MLEHSTLTVLGASILITLALPMTAYAQSCTDTPTSTSALETALANASAGDVICLDRTYTYNSSTDAMFEAVDRSGTASNPIVLEGINGAGVLEGTDTSVGAKYVLHLDGCDYWELRDFTARTADKGIILDDSNNNLIDNVTITGTGTGTGTEGVHFRTHSSDNIIQNSTIKDTGLETAHFGEGVYVGSANSNWDTYTEGDPDLSDNNQILDNTFGPDMRSEAIDIKEGTTGTLVDGNLFIGTDLPSSPSYVDSWIDIKGDEVTVSNNLADEDPSDGKLVKGFAVVKVKIGPTTYGNDNYFIDNDITLIDGSYGFSIGSGTSGNIVCEENNVSGATFSNISTTDCRPSLISNGSFSSGTSSWSLSVIGEAPRAGPWCRARLRWISHLLHPPTPRSTTSSSNKPG